MEISTIILFQISEHMEPIGVTFQGHLNTFVIRHLHTHLVAVILYQTYFYFAR